jgi:hypothetical protein
MLVTFAVNYQARPACRCRAHGCTMKVLCGGAEFSTRGACRAVQAGARVPPDLVLSKGGKRARARALPAGTCWDGGTRAGRTGRPDGRGPRAQGHPFNAALRENRAMVATLQYGGIGFALLVLDLVPGMNGAMSLVRALLRLGAGCVPLNATFLLRFPGPFSGARLCPKGSQ